MRTLRTLLRLLHAVLFRPRWEVRVTVPTFGSRDEYLGTRCIEAKRFRVRFMARDWIGRVMSALPGDHEIHMDVATVWPRDVETLIGRFMWRYRGLEDRVFRFLSPRNDLPF